MSAIKLDPELRARLNGLNEHLEVQNENGEVVGHFLPESLYRELLYCWAREQFSDKEERELALAEPGGLTTPEAIAWVEQFIRDQKGRS